MSFSRISYSGLFTHVENQVSNILGYTTGITQIELLRSKVLTDFYLDVCRPLIFGSPMGATHIKPVNNKWHGNETYRVLMYFIIQQISVYISDNNGNWDDVVKEAVERIIIPKITSDTVADVNNTVELFKNHGWLFAAWVMQNTKFRRVANFLELAKAAKDAEKGKTR